METRPAHRKRRRAASALAALAAGAALLAAAACSGSVVHTYRTFSSALDRGASCAELHDQRARFDNPDIVTRIDADLERIGCTSPEATRTDR